MPEPSTPKLSTEASVMMGELAAIKVLCGALIATHPNVAQLQRSFNQTSERLISDLLAHGQIDDVLNNAMQDLSQQFSTLIGMASKGAPA